MSTKSPAQADITIGQNIRRMRLVKGLTQEALAAQIGITFQQVQKYEKGTNRVGGSRMVQIAQALGVSVVELYDGAELGSLKTKSPDASSVTAQTRQEVEMLHAFRRLDPAVRTKVLGLAEQVAEMAAA
jgi:transcriptional regulator with XRE-family HTH domain